MNRKEIMSLEEVLLDIMHRSAKAWVYLPKEGSWNLNSKCAVLESEEVPPDHEDDPDAGIPEFAKQNNLVQALPVVTVQDIVANAQAQKGKLTPEDLFNAFEYYYKHDAFIILK